MDKNIIGEILKFMKIKYIADKIELLEGISDLEYYLNILEILFK